MTSKQLYNLCYSALRIFHWGVFFLVVEILFYFAGWILFGIMSNCLSWILLPQQNSDKGFFSFLPTAGKYVGLIMGVFCMGFVMARYAKPSNAR